MIPPPSMPNRPSSRGLRHAVAIALVGMAGLGACFPAAAATVSLVPVADATIYEESSPAATANGAGEFLLAGRTNQAANSRRHSLLRFDLSALPVGATISSATLRLHLIAVNTADTSISLHRLTTAWTEGPANPAGNESTGVAAAIGDVTWLAASQSSLLWTSAGGDADANPSATTTVGAAAGLVSWSSPTMVSEAQAWLDLPATNFGWLLRDGESTPQTAKRFASRENADPALRPELIIEFTPVPEPSTVWLLPAGLVLFRRHRHGASTRRPTITLKMQRCDAAATQPPAA